jgi:hypothetical protein
MNRDASSVVTGLISGLVKLALTVGALIVGAVGLFTGNWTIVLLGVGMFLLGQVVHAMDQRALDRQLERWASETLGGVSPDPPRSVRMHLIRSSVQTEGWSGDTKLGFQLACRAWVAEQQLSRSDNRRLGVGR